MTKYLIRYRLPDDRSGEFRLARDFCGQTVRYLAGIAEYTSWRLASDFWSPPEPSTHYNADLNKIVLLKSARSVQKKIADSFFKYALPKSLFISEDQALTIDIDIRRNNDQQLKFSMQVSPPLSDNEVTAYKMLCRVVADPLGTVFVAPKGSSAPSHQNLARAIAGVVTGESPALDKALKDAAGSALEDSLIVAADDLCGHLVRAFCDDLFDTAAWVKLQPKKILQQIDDISSDPLEYTDAAYFLAEQEKAKRIAEIESELDL